LLPPPSKYARMEALLSSVSERPAARRVRAAEMCESNAPRELIDQATCGNRAALEQLLLAHYGHLSNQIAPKLIGKFARVIGVEDILQETFIQAIRNVQKCQAGDHQSFSAWLSTIADNCLLDAIKGLGRKKRGGDRVLVGGPAADTSNSIADLVEMLSDHGRTPSQSVARREAVRAIQIGIAGLPGDQREAVQLHHLAGKSIKETAAAMQRSPGAVRGLLQRAKQALRDSMVRSTLWLSKK
jgi:RNA polymerase sigma-70 factor (ECF subfamily)